MYRKNCGLFTVTSKVKCEARRTSPCFMKAPVKLGLDKILFQGQELKNRT